MKLTLLILLSFAVIPDSVLGAAALVRQLLDENRIEEAVPICRQYEVLPTRDDEVYFACAWVYYRTYRATAAETLLGKLKNAKSAPEYQLLQIYGSFANHLLPPEEVKKMDGATKQQYDDKVKLRIAEAQKLLEPFISTYKAAPIGKRAQELNAELYELKGQLEPAAFIYRGLIADNPKSARAHWGLGRYYLARGDFRRAKTHLEKTAELWPKHLGSRYNIALIYITEGTESYPIAAKWLTEAFKLDSADIGVLEQIGVVLENGKKIPAALKYWKRALELNPTASIALKKMEQYSDYVIDDLIAKNKWEEALAKIDSLTVGSVDPEKFNLQRGVCYRNLGEFKKAESYLRPLADSQVEPRSLVSRELGIVEFNFKRLDEAQKLFEKALSLDKNEPLNHAWLGFVFEAKKDYQAAMEAWNKAASLFKESADVKRALEKVVRLENKLGVKREVAKEPVKSEPAVDESVEW